MLLRLNKNTDMGIYSAFSYLTCCFVLTSRDFLMNRSEIYNTSSIRSDSGILSGVETSDEVSGNSKCRSN